MSCDNDHHYKYHGRRMLYKGVWYGEDSFRSSKRYDEDYWDWWRNEQAEQKLKEELDGEY